MASQNPIPLPLKYGDSKYAIAFMGKNWSGGNNISKTLIAKLGYGGIGILYGDQILPITLDTAQSMIVRAVLMTPTAGTSGQKVRLEFACLATKASESEDPSGWTQTVAQSVDVSAWAAKTQYRVDFTLTASNFEAGDMLQYYLKRDPTHTDDNHDYDLTVLKLALVAYY